MLSNFNEQIVRNRPLCTLFLKVNNKTSGTLAQHYCVFSELPVDSSTFISAVCLRQTCSSPNGMICWH